MSENLQKVLSIYEKKIQKDWEEKFLQYLKSIKKSKKSDPCIERINSDRDSFLGIYSSVTNYTKGIYDIRYKGQKIMSLQNGIVKKIESNNKIYFNSIPEDIVNKSLNESIMLLRNITEKKEINSKEHIFESRLLKYLNSSEKNILRQITPVTINGLFFQMPTFFKASKHGEEEFSLGGGGIDILARIKCRNVSPRSENCLCVMELKDSITKGSEEPLQIIQQAMAYACCIQKLIRSEHGQEWYDVFREQNNSKEIPSPLVLYACVVVPFGKAFQRNNIPESYKIEDELLFSNGDKLRLRYVYLEMNENYTEIIGNPVTNLELKVL